MDEFEVLEALGHLIAATPGWSNETAEEYTMQLLDLDSPVALKAACISIARSWDTLMRPSLKVILDSYDRELVFTTTAIEPPRIHCDGSSVIMVDLDDGTRYGRPCPRCSPALAAVVRDRDKAEQYLRGGAALEHVADDVERVSNRLRYRGGFRPPRCHRADETDEMVTPEVGVKAARAAWLDDRADQSAKALKAAAKHFDELVGSIGRSSRRPRKAAAE